MSYENYLLTINISKSFEDAMIDCLLTIEAAHGFSSYPINAHNYLRHKNLSPAEQVSGRQGQMLFQIAVDKKTLAVLLTRLKEQFSGSGLQYWLTPIVDHGEI